MQKEGDIAMIRTKVLIAGLLGTVLLLASSARAQEDGFMRHEVAVQGTGFFTKDSQQNGTLEHTTNTGGFLVNYRFHINGWLAAEANYGYDRNTQQNFTPTGTFGIRSNVHQATGALVVNLPVYVARMRPYVLAGAGALLFDPTDNSGGFVSGVQRQGRPDCGSAAPSSNVTAHTANPSAGLVFHFYPPLPELAASAAFKSRGAGR